MNVREVVVTCCNELFTRGELFYSWNFPRSVAIVCIYDATQSDKFLK